MDPIVFVAVLLAAAMHAGWNAVVKIGLDHFLSVTLIALFAALVSAPIIPFVALPSAAAWPWLLASAVLHTGYKVFLIAAYRAGDLGQVYPIARGSAPLLVTGVMIVGFGEPLAPGALLGVGLLIAGVWLMSLRGGHDLKRVESRSVAFALATSLFIAAYTITDGVGARINGSPHGYTVWLFFIDGLLMLAVLLLTRGVKGAVELRLHWQNGFAGGAMSLSAYWIAIWAMTLAPIALVAALRESSVLFAAAISVLILKEPLTRWRTVSALAIVAGIVVLRVS
jgi:drug/metabolite transporter (DMT)-like permease